MQTVDDIVHVGGNLFWNRTAGFKFFRVGIGVREVEIRWVDDSQLEEHFHDSVYRF